MDSWLLVICLFVGRLTVPTEGAIMKWVKHNRPRGMHLENIPTRAQEWYEITLYQHLQDREKSLFKTRFIPIAGNSETEFYIGEWSEIDKMWEGDSKIVRATVKYPDGMLMRSKFVNSRDGKEFDQSVGELKFEETVEKEGDLWKFRLLDVPSRGEETYVTRMYQQREEGKWFPVRNQGFSCNPLGKDTISFEVYDSIFEGSSRVVMVEVEYPKAGFLTTESKSFDLKQSLEVANRREDGTSNDGAIVGCVIGGVCIIVLVVGGIMCYRKRQR